MKHFLLLSLLVFVSVYAEEDLVRYDGYVVFRLIPTTMDQLKALKTLEDSNSTFDFWTSPTFENQSVDIMVAPQQIAIFKKITTHLGIQPEVLIPDVQKHIDENNYDMIKYYGQKKH